MSSSKNAILAANALKKELEAKPFLDVGTGVEKTLGVRQIDMREALGLLTEAGYTVHRCIIPQQGTERRTIVKILARPETTYAQARAAVLQGNVQPVRT